MPCDEATIAATAVDPPAVPLSVVQARRDVCRECEHATRSAEPRFAVNRGLTSLSVCQIEKARHPERACHIAVGTTMPHVRCPLGKWPAIER